MIIIIDENDYIEEENSIAKNVFENLNHVIIYDFSEYEVPAKMFTAYLDLIQISSAKKEK